MGHQVRIIISIPQATTKQKKNPDSKTLYKSINNKIWLFRQVGSSITHKQTQLYINFTWENLIVFNL